MATRLVLVPLFGMPGLGEWIVILAAMLFFFGASKLPQLGKGLGEGIRNLKKGLKGDDNDGEKEKETEKEQEKQLPAAPSTPAPPSAQEKKEDK